ncbi:MAG: helicase-exonuclease AddAB subunit AddA [Clostridiales bacterium]|nr:helicase-exonuclease AddAB subunit AddA [Clostridiales bacterium]
MWTNSQQQAIEERNKNILVSAAAGSGKTAVLVERIKQLIINDNISIEKMLIVTFTNAAAAEMRERISAAISQALDNPSNQESFLRNQLNLINRANISTFHSFCIEILKNYFYLIDIEPDFKICDEAQKIILQTEALEELLDMEFERGEDDFIAFADRYASGKDDEEIKDIILYTFNFIQSLPEPLAWLKEKAEELDTDFDDFINKPLYRKIISGILFEIESAECLLEKAETICNKIEGLTVYLPVIQGDMEKLAALRDAFIQDDKCLKEKLQQIDFSRLPPVKGEASGFKEIVKKIRDEVKNIIQQLKEAYGDKDIETYIKEQKEVYPYARCLYDLVERFSAIYGQKKAERNLFDFNDLEHRALEILKIEEVSQEYRDKFSFIFIDEYQDSNIVQETLISHIKRENNLFMVGDVKQSIYRFRLADPLIFINKYDSFKEESCTSDIKIDLNLNFRSKSHIIHGTNYIFKNLMHRRMAEIEYDEDAYLYKGLCYSDSYDYPIELKLIEHKSSQEDEIDEEIQEMKKVEMEAYVAAEKIKSLIGTEIYDCKKEEVRRASYRDIVILLRTIKGWMQIYYEVFLQENIPVYVDAEEGYFETIEIGVFLNLISLIDNRKQDIPLLSVLRSPIGGFMTDEIVEIRLKAEGKFYHAFETYACEDEPLAKKCRKFSDKINAWKKKSTYLPVDEFLWVLLKETGYETYIRALPGGAQRYANMRVLIEKAKQFQSTTMKGLFDFLRFMDQVKKTGSSINTAKVIGENEDVVRIMSIHKSKGLEFPIVLVGGLGKRFNKKTQTSKVILHKDIGIGMRNIDPSLGVYFQTLNQQLIKKELDKEFIAEEMRILYVAFTRARDRLVLLGTISDLQKTREKWMIYDENYVHHGSNYLDWIIPVLLRHEHCKNELVKILEYPADLYDCKEDASLWNIEKITKRDMSVDKERAENKKEDIRKGFFEGFETEDDEAQKIADLLEWTYDYSLETQIPSKLTVTEIRKLTAKEMKFDEMDMPKRVQGPSFTQHEHKFTAMERGTIMHLAMQHMDIQRTESIEEINNQISEMVSSDILKKEEAETIVPERIKRFFDSEIGQRMKESQEVFREVSFNIIKEAREVIPEVETEEKILVQGTIDCYFKEDDGYVLLDYKNDFLDMDDLYLKQVEIIVDKYKVQLELYKEALEKIKGLNIKETYLYLFSIEKAILVN